MDSSSRHRSDKKGKSLLKTQNNVGKKAISNSSDVRKLGRVEVAPDRLYPIGKVTRNRTLYTTTNWKK